MPVSAGRLTDAPVAAVDVGATKVLAGLIGRDGAVYRSERRPMDSRSRATVLASICGALDALLGPAREGPAPLALGIGVVGQADPASGTWVQAMNLPICEPMPLAADLGARYGLSVAVDNDVHAATLAELRLGAGRGASDMLYLNVGTGVAVGIVANGQLVRGAANYAGEVGHMVVEPGGELCPCGQRGCLEPIASGGGIVAQARAGLARHPGSALARESELTAGVVFQAADAGDPLALAVAGRAVSALGTALSNLVNVLNPELVVLGGGVFAGGWLHPRLEGYVAAHALPAARRALRGVLLSPLDVGLVGLLGAATLAWDRIGSAL